MVDGLLEVIVYVEDMQRQVTFYRDVLGLAVQYPAGQVDYSDEMWVTFDTGGCVLALHGGGQGRVGEDAPKLVFAVRDIESARAELDRHGVPVSAVRTPAPGIEVCDARDPEGNVFSVEAHAASGAGGQ